MTRSTLSPTALKVSRILRNAKREALTLNEIDSIDDAINYQFTDSLECYDYDSMSERDFSIGLEH